MQRRELCGHVPRCKFFCQEQFCFRHVPRFGLAGGFSRFLCGQCRAFLEPVRWYVSAFSRASSLVSSNFTPANARRNTRRTAATPWRGGNAWHRSVLISASVHSPIIVHDNSTRALRGESLSSLRRLSVCFSDRYINSTPQRKPSSWTAAASSNRWRSSTLVSRYIVRLRSPVRGISRSTSGLHRLFCCLSGQTHTMPSPLYCRDR